MTKIALVISNDRGLGTIQAINLFRDNTVQEKNVVLKPNFNAAYPPPGSTAFETLHALVLKFRELGAISITLAERSGPQDTQKVMGSTPAEAVVATLESTKITMHNIEITFHLFNIKPPSCSLSSKMVMNLGI